MEWDELPGLFPALAGPERWLPLLQRHLEILIEADAHTRVTTVTPGDAVRRHYAESLEIWRIVLESVGGAPGRAVDVGSGGGFPGLVMACVAPETRFALVEPLKKRARLLEAAGDALGLTNVRVYALRAEEAGQGELRASADLVIARAVAKLPELLEYTAPFADRGGVIALPKGSALAEELPASARALAVLGCSHRETVRMRPEISETLSVAFFEKTGPTPKQYPRRPGAPGKFPL